MAHAYIGIVLDLSPLDEDDPPSWERLGKALSTLEQIASGHVILALAGRTTRSLLRCGQHSILCSLKKQASERKISFFSIGSTPSAIVESDETNRAFLDPFLFHPCGLFAPKGPLELSLIRIAREQHLRRLLLDGALWPRAVPRHAHGGLRSAPDVELYFSDPELSRELMRETPEPRRLRNRIGDRRLCHAEVLLPPTVEGLEALRELLLQLDRAGPVIPASFDAIASLFPEKEWLESEQAGIEAHGE